MSSKPKFKLRRQELFDGSTNPCTEAVYNAQIAILNETTIRFTPEAFEHFMATIFEHFMATINAPIAPMPAKMRERLSRPKPW